MLAHLEGVHICNPHLRGSRPIASYFSFILNKLILVIHVKKPLYDSCSCGGQSNLIYLQLYKLKPELNVMLETIQLGLVRCCFPIWSDSHSFLDTPSYTVNKI